MEPEVWAMAVARQIHSGHISTCQEKDERSKTLKIVFAPCAAKTCHCYAQIEVMAQHLALAAERRS